MPAKDALKQVIRFCHRVTRMYVEDLGDQDLLVRSVPGANHIAWQLGHAVSSTARASSHLATGTLFGGEVKIRPGTCAAAPCTFTV